MKLLLLLILLLPFASGSLEITEVMYNPSSVMGSDSDFEWIELYNPSNEIQNLSQFTLNGRVLPEYSLPAKSYIIIAKELTDGSDKDTDSFQSFYNNITAIDGTFSLSNNEGIITLNNDSFYYEDDWGGDGNGYSIEKVGDIWLESNQLYGTPGQPNTANPDNKPRDIELTLNVNKPLYTKQLNNNLFKIKFNKKSDCSVKETVTLNYSLTKRNHLIQSTEFQKTLGCSTTSNTVSITFLEGGNYVLCGNLIFPDQNLLNNHLCANITVIDLSKIPCQQSININTEKLLHQNREPIKYQHNVSSKLYPFEITYWVEDLFGTIIKEKVTTTSTSKRSYTPRIVEQDRVYWLKAKLNSFCNDTTPKDNEISKMAIIINPSIEEIPSSSGESDSTIEIKKITPKTPSFGNLIKVDLEIYKGSTSKYSLSAYLEKNNKKISEVTKINLKNKFTDYKITLPIQIDPNCNEKVKEGSATLIIDGLGVKEDEKIKIEGLNKNICGKSVTPITKETTITEPKLAQKVTEEKVEIIVRQEIIQKPSKLVVYESSSKKAKNLIPYILTISFILLIIVVLKTN